MVLAALAAALGSVGCSDADGEGDDSDIRIGDAAGDSSDDAPGDAPADGAGGDAEDAGDEDVPVDTGPDVDEADAADGGGDDLATPDAVADSTGDAANDATGDAGAGGTCEWQRTFGGNSVDVATAVMAIEDDVVVVGQTFSVENGIGEAAGAFAIRLAPDGSTRWSHTYPIAQPAFVGPGLGDNLVIAGVATDAAACENYHGLQDAWVAEVDAETGALGAYTCIGGDDDDSAASAVPRAEGTPDAHYVVVGVVDSHDNGNVGPNHNGGGFEQTDALIAFWQPDGDAEGFCFGSNAPDGAVGFIGDTVAGYTLGGDSGDLAETTPLGGTDTLFIDLDEDAPCEDTTCYSVRRVGGEGGDRVDLARNGVAAGTSGSEGDFGCAAATGTTLGRWVIDGDDSAALADHGCWVEQGVFGISGLDADADYIYLAGLTGNRTAGLFADAPVRGTPTENRGPYVARWRRDALSGDPEPIFIADGGNSATFEDVAVRADGCVVAVGNVRSSVFPDALVYSVRFAE